jgi:hypothetical protein
MSFIRFSHTINWPTFTSWQFWMLPSLCQSPKEGCVYLVKCLDNVVWLNVDFNKQNRLNCFTNRRQITQLGLKNQLGSCCNFFYHFFVFKKNWVHGDMGFSYPTNKSTWQFCWLLFVKEKQSRTTSPRIIIIQTIYA